MRAGFVLGFGACLLFVACASFSYPYYILNLEEQKLQHPSDPLKDKALKVCGKDEAGQYRCIVMDLVEFYGLKKDYLRIANELEACQKRCP